MRWRRRINECGESYLGSRVDDSEECGRIRRWRNANIVLWCSGCLNEGNGIRNGWLGFSGILITTRPR